MAAIALVAVLAMGTTAVSAAFGSFDSNLPFFAQNGNGNGNGGRSGENPQNPPGTGNNGQGQGAENGNPPADPGSGNNSQGNGNGNAEVPAAPDADETEDTAAEDAAADEPQAAPVNPGSDKVDVCHVTGNGDSILINISSQAIPAHERHGDTVMGEGAEAECGETADEAPAETAPEDATPEASPVPDEDGDDATEETETGTPAASPAASPVASPVVDGDGD